MLGLSKLNVSSSNFNIGINKNLANEKGKVIAESTMMVANASQYKYLGTHGIQSCCALFVYDPIKKTGGIAHINTNHPEIISNIVNKIVNKMPQKDELQWNIVGGYILFSGNDSMISEAVKNCLENKNYEYTSHYTLINHPFATLNPYMDLDTGTLNPTTNDFYPCKTLQEHLKIIENTNQYYTEVEMAINFSRKLLRPIVYHQDKSFYIDENNNKQEATKEDINLSNHYDIDEVEENYKQIMQILNHNQQTVLANSQLNNFQNHIRILLKNLKSKQD